VITGTTSKVTMSFHAAINVASVGHEVLAGDYDSDLAMKNLTLTLTTSAAGAAIGLWNVPAGPTAARSFLILPSF